MDETKIVLVNDLLDDYEFKLNNAIQVLEHMDDVLCASIIDPCGFDVETATEEVLRDALIGTSQRCEDILKLIRTELRKINE